MCAYHDGKPFENFALETPDKIKTLTSLETIAIIITSFIIMVFYVACFSEQNYSAILLVNNVFKYSPKTIDFVPPQVL